LCRLADENFAILAERDDRRRSAVALAILDHLGLPALHDRDAGIGGPEVDTDHFTHNVLSPTNLRKTVETCSNLALTQGLAKVFQASGGQTAPFASSVAGRSSRDYHPRRPQQPAIQRVALLEHCEDGIRLHFR